MLGIQYVEQKRYKPLPSWSLHSGEGRSRWRERHGAKQISTDAMGWGRDVLQLWTEVTEGLTERVIFLKDLNESESMIHVSGSSDQITSLPGSSPSLCLLLVNRAPFLSSKCPNWTTTLGGHPTWEEEHGKYPHVLVFIWNCKVRKFDMFAFFPVRWEATRVHKQKSEKIWFTFLKDHLEYKRQEQIR